MYVTLAFTCMAIIYGVFIPEVISDIKFKGRKMCKQPAIILKFVGIAYATIYIAAIILFIIDMVNITPTHALEITILYFIAICVISFFYIVASVLWLDLLMKTKNIGFSPGWVKFFKVLFIILAGVGCPASSVLVIMNTYGIGAPLTGTLAASITIIYLILPLIITLVYILKTFCSVYKLSVDSRTTNQAIINKIKKKTIALMVADLVLIVNTIDVIATFKVGTNTSGFIMFRAYFTLIIAFGLTICLWLFIRTHKPMNYIIVWASGISRNSTSISSSTGGTGGTGGAGGTGSSSARGSQSTPSTVISANSDTKAVTKSSKGSKNSTSSKSTGATEEK
jgi:hypothetical protein